MPVELVVPSVGESITEVQIGAWLKAQGDFVNADESIVEIESDKATVELPAPISGIITEIKLKEGDQAEVGAVVGYMEAAEAPAKKEAAPAPTDEKPAAKKAAPVNEKPVAKKPEAAPAKASAPAEPVSDESRPSQPAETELRVMPAAQRLLDEHGLLAEKIEATGPGGRLLKEDVLTHIAKAPDKAPDAEQNPMAAPMLPGREEERVPMSPMRKRIAQRLVQAQQSAALLTTFNEVDMTAVMALRKKYNDEYVKKHGVKLGFMSFFVKASIEALKEFPQVNAYIDGTEIVYHNYFDIGIAIGGGKGLVVPVLRNAERMSFAEIETTIGELAARAKDNKIALEELQGGTFTISNGGVYGSMLSTPIINPPQSGILGLHAIQDRAVVVDGQVVARPIMYVALTYDHRIVDGREAVTFLRRIKSCIEDPARILVEI